MPEPLTVVGAGLAILGSKDILNRLLGPTADYLGGKTAGLIEKCDVNLDNIFLKAHNKLGDRIHEEGAVSPRVLRHVIEDGRFCEDELIAEYYGGMLAASRTAEGLDDRGVPHLSRVKEMSAYQIRLHFIIYIEILKIFHGKDINIGNQEERPKLKIFIPYVALAKSFEREIDDSFFSIFTHSINGLHGHGLINSFAYGSIEHLQKSFKGAPSPGVLVEPTFAGAELFMWAIGAEDPNGHKYLQASKEKIESPFELPGQVIQVTPG